MKIQLVKVTEGFLPLEDDVIVCVTDIYPTTPGGFDVIPVTFNFKIQQKCGLDFAKERFPGVKIEFYPAKCPTCHREK